MSSEKDFDELLETAFRQRMERDLRSVPSQTKLDSMFPVTDEGIKKTENLIRDPISVFWKNAKKYIAVAAVAVIVGLSVFAVLNMPDEEMVYSSPDSKVHGAENYGSVRELIEDLDRKIYLPVELPVGYEVEHIRTKGQTVDILWKNNNGRIGLIINPSSEKSEYDMGGDLIYTKDGTAFVVSGTKENCQAYALTNDCEYMIEANILSDLVIFIENLELH